MGKKSKRKAMLRRRRIKALRKAAPLLVVLIVFVAGALILPGVFSGKTRQDANYVEGGEAVVYAPPFSVDDPNTQQQLSEEELAAIFKPQPTVPPLDVTDAVVTITAVGDCTLGGTINGDTYKRFVSLAEKNGYDYFFEDVREIFENDDITLVNLEGPLTTATVRRKDRTFNFKGQPEFIEILTSSGVEAANVANNHAYDYEQQGFDDTLALLKENNIAVCGFGEWSTMEVNNVVVGFLGFTEWYDELSDVKKIVKQKDTECDILVVSIHAGKETQYKETLNQKELAHAVVDAGADLVIGTHSHVIGGIDNYKGVQIVYSLGNFCFGGNDHPHDTDAYIYQQTFMLVDGEVRTTGAKVYPVSTSTSRTKNDFHPVLLHGDDAKRVLKKIAKFSKNAGLEIVEAVY